MKKIINKKLCEFYRQLPCVACGIIDGTVVGHHIITKGAGGHDVVENLIPLCVKHHSEVHSGRETFFNKYSHLKDYLRSAIEYQANHRKKK